MAKKHVRRNPKPTFTSFIRKDLAGWNFVLFLTLALLLIVAVMRMSQNLTDDLRTRAGLKCPDPLVAFNGQLPRPQECNGTWQLTPNARGCQVFVCKPE